MENEIQNIAKQNHQCLECGKSFKTPQGLGCHKMRVHSDAGKNGWKKGIKKVNKRTKIRIERDNNPDSNGMEINFCPGCGCNLAGARAGFKMTNPHE